MYFIIKFFLVLSMTTVFISCNESKDDSSDSCGSLGCWTSETIEEMPGYVNDIIHDGTQWVAVGYKEVSGIDQPTLWHSIDMKTWSSINIYTVTASSKAYTVTYDGTRWIAGGTDHSNADYEAVLWYSSSLTDGWTKLVLDNSGGGGAGVNGLYYASSDGRYIAVGQVGHGSGTAMAWHTSSDPTATWNSTILTSGGSASSITRRSSDEMWLAGGQIDGSPASGAVWIIQSDFSGNTVQIPLLTDTESSISAVAESSTEGKDIAVGYLAVDDNTYAYLWHADSGTSSWIDMNFTTDQWAHDIDLIYNGVRWLNKSKNRIWYSDSITGDWVENETNGAVTCSTITYSSANITWMIGGRTNDMNYPVILYLSGE